MKNKNDIILPGHGLYWILGAIVAVLGLLALTGAYFANTGQDYDGYSQSKGQETVITPEKMQSGVSAMADFMVKDGNVVGLRMWARSLGVSSPEFSSATTLREEIRRASNDFAVYRNKDEFSKLIELLGSNDAILQEVVW